jgi:ubiquinone/menaquinone biosynthesis C-methylase UbiE
LQILIRPVFVLSILQILLFCQKMIERILEPEVMDSDQDALEYDAMDHTAVNSLFVADLLAVIQIERPVTILDLGVGTGQIPIELCRRAPNVGVVAIDAAESMLTVARENVAAAGLADRIELVLADAKRLPFPADSFAVVISNSIVHHIPEPASVLAEAVRVASAGGILFHRDLARPTDDAQLARIVATYAGDASPYQQKLFSESLRAALTLKEIQSLVCGFGFAPETVRLSSDRHWTWIAVLDDAALSCRSDNQIL